MILHDDTIHNLKEKDKDSGQRPWKHNLEITRNLRVILCNDDPVNNLKRPRKQKEIWREQPTENERLTCNLPDENELTCERQVTWTRSEEDEEQVEGECSLIDEGDIPKQKVLKIPTLSSDEIDQTSQVRRSTRDRRPTPRLTEKLGQPSIQSYPTVNSLETYKINQTPYWGLSS